MSEFMSCSLNLRKVVVRDVKKTITSRKFWRLGNRSMSQMVDNILASWLRGEVYGASSAEESLGRGKRDSAGDLGGRGPAAIKVGGTTDE